MTPRLRYRLARLIYPEMARARPPVVGWPISEFFERGWHHELNRKVANPEGLRIAFHVNDDLMPDGTPDDGAYITGWIVVPIGHHDGPEPTEEQMLERRTAWRRHVDEILHRP